MKHEEFKTAIKDVSEQFHVVRTEGVTEVHWIYGGFDLYESGRHHAMHVSQQKSTRLKSKKPFSMFKEAAPDDGPKYHVIAEISETQEHVLNVNIDAVKLPEKMRRRVLPVITDYTITPIEKRDERPESKGVIVKSGDELRKERKREREALRPDEPQVTVFEPNVKGGK